MATNKQLNARVALKHDTEANWETAGEHGFCPLAGEVIIYDIEDNVCSQLRYKIGRKNAQGELININLLPFETNVYIGTTEPEDAPIGFLWIIPDAILKEGRYRDNSSSDYSTLHPFTYEDGMTWSDWVVSQYNYQGWSLQYIIDSNGYSLGLGIVPQNNSYCLTTEEAYGNFVVWAEEKIDAELLYCLAYADSRIIYDKEAM